MTQSVGLIVFPVRDLSRAKALFSTLLGTEPYADAPYYVGFRVDGQEIGLDPNGHARGVTAPLPYWEVPDIQSALDSLLAAGAETVQPISDVGGGKLVASVKDPDSNVIGLMQSP